MIMFQVISIYMLFVDMFTLIIYQRYSALMSCANLLNFDALHSERSSINILEDLAIVFLELISVRTTEAGVIKSYDNQTQLHASQV